MKVRELHTEEEFFAAYPIMQQMYPKLTETDYQNIIKQRRNDGFRMIAAFDGKTCLGVAGFWINIRFYCGKFIQIDNMIKDSRHNSKGVGKALLDWVKAEGKKEGCNRVLLDTYVDNHDAHRLFIREGFIIRGYHLNYDIEAA